MIKSFTCKQCGVQFSRSVFPSDHKEGRTMEYCSRKCYQDARPKLSKIICRFCNKVIEKPLKRRTVFCSKQCQLEAWKLPRKRVCQTCKKTFYVKDEGRPGKFCSHKCRGASLIAKPEPFYHKAYRGPRWERIAKSVRERDNFTCQICHKVLAEKTIDVHHIIPFRKFGADFEAANDTKNLISLCHYCHAQIERGKITL